MDPSTSLLNSLEESIVSGIFVDTKIYVFSRRDASGRVGSPRPLYCNSHVLNTVPYLSSLFSDGFSEGQIRDINDGFPTGALPYTDSYDNLSDSDLEEEEPERPHGSNPEIPVKTPESLPQASQVANKVETHVPNNGLVRTGKVAVIRDVAAVTFEAMIYFLYTGKITFAPLTSDLRHNLPAGARAGDWNSAKPPSPSAKSIYRLADKYDIPALKERAKEYIHANLVHCDIIDEVFSGFSSDFPEILSFQVSQLVSKAKKESKGNTDCKTRRQLLDKIASLSQPQLERAADALAMIWSGATEPSDSPQPKSKSNTPANLAPVANLPRVELALLKSISTGTFIDLRFHAYSAVINGLSYDPKLLFASSIVIEDWRPSIKKEATRTKSQPAHLADGLIDDYESFGRELRETPRKDEAVLSHQTEASTGSANHKVVILRSGAWKTWMSLFSYAHTNKITFAPLETEAGPVVEVGAQSRQSCSPRSMYSLATTLGIENIKEKALEGIRSKLTPSNIMQELFTSFAARHTAVMEMEIEFFYKNSKKNPKLLIDHIQKMKSGEAPFFPTTLGLVYDKLFGDPLTQPDANSSGLGRSLDAGNESIAKNAPAIPPPPASSPSIGRSPVPHSGSALSRFVPTCLYWGTKTGVTKPS